MKKIFCLLFIAFALATGLQAQKTKSTTISRIIAKDSIRLGGVWRSTWPSGGGGGAGTYLETIGNTGLTTPKLGTLDNTILNLITNNKTLLILNPDSTVKIKTRIAQADSSEQVAHTQWIKQYIEKYLIFDSTFDTTQISDKITQLSVNFSNVASITYVDNAIQNITQFEGWGIRGNLNTDSTENFVGTTDSAALVFRTSNTNRAFIDKTGTINIMPRSAGNGVSSNRLDFISRDSLGIHYRNAHISSQHFITPELSGMELYSSGNIFTFGSGGAGTQLVLGGNGTVRGTNALKLYNTSTTDGITIGNDYFQSSGGRLLTIYSTSQYNSNALHRMIMDTTGRTKFADSAASDFTPSAQLEVNSTKRGFLPPRMTTAQMNAISSPANGLMIYNTTDTALYVYKHNAWKKMVDESTSINLSNASLTANGDYEHNWAGHSTTISNIYDLNVNASDAINLFASDGINDGNIIIYPGKFIVPVGNVGIGTNTPAVKLDVTGSMNLSGTEKISEGVWNAIRIEGDSYIIAVTDKTIVLTNGDDVTLPPASSCYASNLGQIFIIKNLTGSSINLIPDGTDEIDLVNAPFSIADGQSVTVQAGSSTSWIKL